AHLRPHRDQLADDVLLLVLFFARRAADDVALKAGELDPPEVSEPALGRRERTGRVGLRRERERETRPCARALVELTARLRRRRRVGCEWIDGRDRRLERTPRLVEARQLAERLTGADVRSPRQVDALDPIRDRADGLRAVERGAVVAASRLRERETEPRARRVLVLVLRLEHLDGGAIRGDGVGELLFRGLAEADADPRMGDTFRTLRLFVARTTAGVVGERDVEPARDELDQPEIGVQPSRTLRVGIGHLSGFVETAPGSIHVSETEVQLPDALQRRRDAAGHARVGAPLTPGIVEHTAVHLDRPDD